MEKAFCNFLCGKSEDLVFSDLPDLIEQEGYLISDCADNLKALIATEGKSITIRSGALNAVASQLELISAFLLEDVWPLVSTFLHQND